MLSNLVQNHLDFIVFIIALLAERFIPLASWYHPNTFYNAICVSLCQRIARPNESNSYQYLAATLAFSLVLLLVVTLVILFMEFAYYPELLSGLLLYLLVDSRNVEKKSLRIAKLLQQKQKSLARELVKALIVRDNQKLSTVGITKAVLESLSLRLARHYFVVIFFYLAAGPIAALSYKLLLLMHQAWRTKLLPDSPMLFPLAKLLFILEWLPMRLLAITIALGKATKQSFHYIKHYGRHYYQTNSGWLLSCCSAAIGCQLGGPAMYQNTRYNKMRIGTARLPEAQDIASLMAVFQQAKAFWLLVILAIEIIKSVLQQ